MAQLCDCCEKREAHPACDGLCVECERTTFCARCDCELENYGWQPGQPREKFCEKCQRKNLAEGWISETKEEVMRLAEAHGWSYERYGWRGGFNTRSEYLTITRRCPFCRGDDEEADCECKELVVRVSDHGSVYCREDVSLAMNPSGDDQTVAYLIKRLKG